MSFSPEQMGPALEKMRRGNLAGARADLDAQLVQHPDAVPLLGLSGLLAGQMGDHAAAASLFRRLLVITPDDAVNRVNLARALVAVGRLDEAAPLLDDAETPQQRKLRAYVHQQQGRLREAAEDYDAVLAAWPADFESWNNLGNVRAAMGDLDGAIEALERTTALKPDAIPPYLTLSELLSRTERFNRRQQLMRRAAAADPSDPAVQTELGLAEASMRAFGRAERAFRRAIELSAGFTSAYLELAMLLENLNRVEDLASLAEQARARGLDEPEIRFVEAWALRRQGRMEEALALAEAVPPSINPVRRAQLLAELFDRLGDPARAFAAFEEMNRQALAARPSPPGPSYREEVAASAALLTPERVVGWRPVQVEHRPPPPIFMVGFPRSGTTLLDTLLMGLPQFHVLEEQPVLHQVQLALGQDERLAGLTDAEANALRARYFTALQEIAPMRSGQTVVDKHPLQMAQVPLIHRIFPDARIIFVERHPCDAVLSCFMSNFQLNHAMRSFADLGEAARTYDTVFDKWERATRLLPVQVHRVRYERMVDDLEAEMRPLLQFLDVPWNPAVLDNQRAASQRGHIRTASYSQVTEPIYRRAAGRWERYRDQLAPVLPILAPWAERMGYPL